MAGMETILETTSDIVRDEQGVPTDLALRGAYHLLWVWLQYGTPMRDGDGVLHLEHCGSGAGEGAAAFLVDRI
jgi:hypothetical protein